MIRNTLIALTATAALAACTPADSSASNGVPLGEYVMVGFGKETVPLRNVSLVLAEGQVSGMGSCNNYTAQNNAALPALQLGPIAATKKACFKGMEFEQKYFDALQAATSVEYNGGVLTVKGPVWMQFEHGHRK